MIETNIDAVRGKNRAFAASFEMKRSLIANFVGAKFAHMPAKQLVADRITQVEGGQMFSLTLRDILAKNYGVSVGDYSYGSLLQLGYCDRHTNIGRYASIGPNVRRFGAAHPATEPSLHPFWYNPALGLAGSDLDRTRCDIADDVWIGANTVILPMCSKIGTGAIIGAGSVVTRDVAPFAVVAGNPAKQIRQRFTVDQQQLLLETNPWQHTPTDALHVIESLRVDLAKMKCN